jgi:hypothetical protein
VAAGHGVQVAAVPVPASEYVPALHAVQEPAPCGEYLPASQSVHVAGLAVADEKEKPPGSENVPARQAPAQADEG